MFKINSSRYNLHQRKKQLVFSEKKFIEVNKMAPFKKSIDYENGGEWKVNPNDGHISTTRRKIKPIEICSAKSTKSIFELQAEYEAYFTPPPFTFKELKYSIPSHLFIRSTTKSFAYLLANLVVCAILFYAATFIDCCNYESQLDQIIRGLAWFIYWGLQGIFAGGLWIIAHECGHYAFSPSNDVNNMVGFILHSLLLVPFFSWQISHAQHHASTGNIEKDQPYIPSRRKIKKLSQTAVSKSVWKEAMQDSPLRGTIVLFLGLIIGWPLHLMMNIGGRKYDEFANHFFPSSPIFKPSQRHLVWASNAGVGGAIALLIYLINTTSFLTVVKYYGVPYLIVNANLLIITLLHHTDVYMPHYSDKSWTFVRGALATIDRDYGWFLNTAFHHINDSHVAHHLFSQMPHYNAIQATPYLKAKLGDYYVEDKTPLLKALWRIVTNCVFIENNGDILFYRRK